MYAGAGHEETAEASMVYLHLAGHKEHLDQNGFDASQILVHLKRMPILSAPECCGWRKPARATYDEKQISSPKTGSLLIMNVFVQ